MQPTIHLSKFYSVKVLYHTVALYVHIYVCTYIYMYIRTYVRMYVLMHVCICIMNHGGGSH